MEGIRNYWHSISFSPRLSIRNLRNSFRNEHESMENTDEVNQILVTELSKALSSTNSFGNELERKDFVSFTDQEAYENAFGQFDSANQCQTLDIIIKTQVVKLFQSVFNIRLHKSDISDSVTYESLQIEFTQVKEDIDYINDNLADPVQKDTLFS